MRIKRKDLQRMIVHLSKLQGRPLEAYQPREEGKPLKQNKGFLHLDFAACYGGYDLVEFTERGEASIVGNNFGGTGRLTLQEMYRWLDGAIWAIENEQTRNAIVSQFFKDSTANAGVEMVCKNTLVKS